MFERFTEKAIKVIMLAQEESRRLGHNFVGTEQILIGLIGEGTGIAAKCLKSMGVNLKDARVEVEKIIGRGSGFVAVEIPFTPRSKRILELSRDESRQLGQTYIGTEHLLLGLIREGEGVAARVLENVGVDLNRLRSHVIRLMGESGAISTEQAVGGERRFVEAGRGEAPTIDKLSDSCLKAIILAREETRRLGHKLVLPEMILLGLIAEDASFAARQLKESGVTLKAARDKVEGAVGMGTGVIPVNSPLSAGAHELMKVAYGNAKSFAHDCVDAEHVLLALLETGNNEMEKVLTQLGIEPSTVKNKLLAELRKVIPVAVARTKPAMPTSRELYWVKSMSSESEAKPEPFSKFTAQAIRVMTLAEEETHRVGHNFIGTEQILLGLIGEGAGTGAIALASQNVTLEDARREVEKIIGRGSGFVAHEIPLTHRAIVVLDYAWSEAQGLGHTYIGTEHLLLGILREGEGVAARVLENLGVDLEKLRVKVLELMKEGGAATA